MTFVQIAHVLWPTREKSPGCYYPKQQWLSNCQVVSTKVQGKDGAWNSEVWSIWLATVVYGKVSRATWRIILVSKCFFTLVGKSSNWDFFCHKLSGQIIVT